MKPKYNASKFRNQTVGASLVTAIVVCFASSASATTWVGDTSTNWNDNLNWTGDAGTGGSNATINTSPANIATISANIVATPVDIFVNGTGRLDHTAGTASTGAGNWMFVANNSGNNAIYNLANTAAAGGGLTGFAQGSGSMDVKGRLYVAGAFNTPASAPIGTANVNTSGTLAIGADLAIGANGGIGVMNVDAGTITSNGWNFIGKNEGGGGANGTLKMSGGILTNSFRTYVGQAATTGTLALTGGTYKNMGDLFIVGEGAGSTGAVTVNNSASLFHSGSELWLGEAGGTGSLTLSMGTVTVNSWLVVGRNGGTGTLTLTGGMVTKTGGGNITIGSIAAGHGSLNISGGLLDVQSGNLFVAEGGTGSSSLSLSAAGEIRTPQLLVGLGGTVTGTVNLNGGTLKTGLIDGGTATANVNFDGTQIIATANATAFISDLDLANINPGGLKIDSNGMTLASAQILSGTGGLTKSGLGTLTLTGNNSYAGATVITAGKLVAAAASPANSPYTSFTVADGATLGTITVNDEGQLTVANATLATSATGAKLDFDLGNFAGNTTAAPLKVTGTIALNGPITINVADTLPSTGTIQLIQYAAKSGAGSFVLGTLPPGVAATLVDTGTSVHLNVTSVALRFWVGGISGAWDINTTVNWHDPIAVAAAKYINGSTVIFDDSVGAGTSAVVLNATVTPSLVTFDNSSVSYTLTGTGKITGSTALTKSGTGSLTLGTSNDYTGVTTLQGGITTVTALANGGAASSVGASAAAAANLVLSGGTLHYTGASTSSTRGFTIAAANSGISTQNNLTLSGPVVSSTGNLIKTGPGNLTLAHTGANVIGTVSQGLRLNEGTLTLSGSGTQTNSVAGELWIGSTPGVSAALVLNNTSLTTGSWIALGIGNGSTGAVSSITATNSTIQSSNFSAGYDGALAANMSTQNVTLTNSTWTNNGLTHLAESLNTTTTLTVSGTSSFIANDRVLIGIGQGSVANVTVENSGSLTKTGGWLAIGNSNNGIGTLTVKDSGTVTSNGDINLGDIGTSQGTLAISGLAVVTSTGPVYVGKGAGTSGTVIQTGGTLNVSSGVTVGNSSGATGGVNVSGGAFNQTEASQTLIVGGEGAGTLTISGTGAVTVAGSALLVSNSATGVGVVNLDGGTLTVKQVAEGAAGAGSGTFNFNGGLLKAGAAANASFMAGLNTATVKAGGAHIDSNGQTIAINQALLAGLGGGGLTKSGAGFLQLNGTNTYTGTTTVSAGSLGGTGSVAGPLVVAAGGTLAPGAAAGTFTAGATTISGIYACEIDGAAADKLVVNGALNLGAATDTLVITTLGGGATQPAYVIASYTSLTGTFAPVSLPGYTLVYNYNDGISSNNIALVASVATAYSGWIAGFYPGETNPAIIGATADPDGDGTKNFAEFALDGNPLSGASPRKVVGKVASVVGSPSLVLTLPVRNGATFSGATEQVSAAVDGVTYTIQGSDQLATWDLVVSEVLGADKTAIETGLPALNSGWTYRTFQSPGAISGDPQDFLRAVIVNP